LRDIRSSGQFTTTDLYAQGWQGHGAPVWQLGRGSGAILGVTVIVGVPDG